jgi:hypothetical protein
VAFDAVEEIQRAQRAGVPIVALNTSDQQSTILTMNAKLNGEDKRYDEAPVLSWNCLNGIRAFKKEDKKENKNKDTKGIALIKHYDNNDPLDGEKAGTVLSPVQMLRHALEMGKRGKIAEDLVFLVENAPRFMDDVQFIQGIMNIRDTFKSNNQTLVLLGPNFVLPPELVQDTLVLDEPLPNTEEIEESLGKFFTVSEVKFEQKALKDYSDALRGLSAFAIEQAAALSLRRKNGDLYVEKQDLWERKRRMIEQVPGLKMERPSETFDEIGGLYQVKEFINDLVRGPCKPVVIVRVEEIEKMVSGAGHAGMGDSSGTSQDQMQQMLHNMEEQEYYGQINFGPPGSGKSLLAKAMASTYGIPLITADFGAAKDSLVGSSENRIRAVFKTIFAMAGKGGAYFVATCNKLHTLSPELQRRFNFGLFFFDLPTAEERVSIGKILTSKKYSTVKDDPEFWRVNAEGWSGANIRDCCKMAYAFNMPIAKAANRIISAAIRDKQGIEMVRDLADGKFLSASYEGKYEKDRVEEDSNSRGRKINVR